MDREAVMQLAKRKEQLWSFMQKMKPLPALLDGMKITGTRDQFRALENVMHLIKEIE